ncbi:MAG: hypothetical protein JXA28_06925, partial [Bacteroidetes bacterium]|nr:hypothetical protein [Bacteroidota bacterium]
MEKSVPYILLALVITTVYTAVQTVGTPEKNTFGETIRSTEIQAHELAVSGVEFALKKLEEEPTWARTEAPSQLTLPGVLIEAIPAQWGNSGPSENADTMACFVVARGSVENASALVEAIIERPRAETLPLALRYALISGSNLHLSQDIVVRDVVGRRQNTNVHTNGNLALRGSTLVQGFGTYSRTLNDEAAAAQSTFIPNVHRDGTGVYRHPQIPLPEIDPTRWESVATRTYASSTTLSGNLSIGTADVPGIWLIKGHLNLKANLSGSGILLVEGDLRLYGNDPAAVIKNADEYLCIVVTGNVFAEDAQQNANIVCGGSFYGSGNVFLFGSLAAQGRIHTSG